MEKPKLRESFARGNKFADPHVNVITGEWAIII